MISDPNECVFFGLIIALQFAAVLSVVVARVSERTSRGGHCHWVLLALLVIVGITTIWMVGCGSRCWMFCGVTLPLIAVGATVDFRKSSSFQPF